MWCLGQEELCTQSFQMFSLRCEIMYDGVMICRTVKMRDGASVQVVSQVWVSDGLRIASVPFSWVLERR